MGLLCTHEMETVLDYKIYIDQLLITETEMHNQAGFSLSIQPVTHVLYRSHIDCYFSLQFYDKLGCIQPPPWITLNAK